MEIQVVRCQVCKNPDDEARAENSLKGQGMGRNLEGAVGAAIVQSPPEKAEEIRGFRSCVMGGVGPVPDSQS